MKSMKNISNRYFSRIAAAMLVACLLSSSISRAAVNDRDFRDAQGRSFKGQVLTYDAAEEIVSIRRADGKTANLKLALFSEPDREYIRRWSAMNDFRNRLNIVPTLRSNKVSSEKGKDSEVDKTITEWWYEVLLENPSSAALGKITYEYCIFYRQGVRDGYTINYDEGIYYNKGTINTIAPASSTVVKTKPINLYTENGNVTVFGQVSSSESNMHGLWLRMTTTLPSGEKVVRDFRTSDDELWAWRTYSIAAGMNEGHKPGSFGLGY